MNRVKDAFNLMGSSNGRRVSVKYKKGQKERLIHFWPDPQEKWKISTGYKPHHMKNLKFACKLFLEAFAFPEFMKAPPEILSDPSYNEWVEQLYGSQKEEKTMLKFLKILYISAIEVAKNGRKYRVVKFMNHTLMPDGAKVFSNVVEGTRTIWEAFTDEQGREFKADGLWNVLETEEAKVGALVEGQIVTLQTYPYRFEGSTNLAKKYTAVVFGNEDATDYINKQLKSVNSCVMYGDNLTAPEQINPEAVPASTIAQTSSPNL